VAEAAMRHLAGALGATHELTLVAAQQRGQALTALGRYAEAEPVLRAALADAPDARRAALADALAALYDAWNRPADAARLRAEAGE
jgi:tetratricopeptide (TPR) repeat protein